MTVRMPRDLTRTSRAGRAADNLSAIEAEVMSESASSLGYQGRQVEKALFALADTEGDTRSQAVSDAAQAVWAYFVQRELCGMRDHRLIVREMGIPDEVLRRLGAAPKR